MTCGVPVDTTCAIVRTRRVNMHMYTGRAPGADARVRKNSEYQSALDGETRVLDSHWYSAWSTLDGADSGSRSHMQLPLAGCLPSRQVADVLGRPPPSVAGATAHAYAHMHRHRVSDLLVAMPIRGISIPAAYQRSAHPVDSPRNHVRACACVGSPPELQASASSLRRMSRYPCG